MIYRQKQTFLGLGDARTWDSGTRDSGTWGRGHGDVGLGDAGTWEAGTWDAGTWDSGTWGPGDLETWGRGGGRDMGHSPDFCAEFATYNFRWSRERYEGEFASS